MKTIIIFFGLFSLSFSKSELKSIPTPHEKIETILRGGLIKFSDWNKIKLNGDFINYQAKPMWGFYSDKDPFTGQKNPSLVGGFSIHSNEKGAFEIAGIKIGDIILEINDISFLNLYNANRFIPYTLEQIEMNNFIFEFKIDRNKQVLKFNVEPLAMPLRRDEYYFISRLMESFPVRDGN